jgi:hypothetical protein
VCAAPNILWRPSEYTQEGTTHSFGIPKSDDLCDALDIGSPGLDVASSQVGPHAFHGACWRGASLDAKGAAELP